MGFHFVRSVLTGLLAALLLATLPAGGLPAFAQTAATDSSKTSGADSGKDTGSATAETGASKTGGKDVAPAKNGELTETQKKIASWERLLDQMAETLAKPEVNDRDLVLANTRATKISSDATELAARLEPEIQALAARVRELTPKKDEDDNAVSDEAKAALQKHQSDFAEINGQYKQAQVIILRASETIDKVNARRRSAFFEGLVKRNRSILSPGLWSDASAALPKLAHSADFMVSNWWRQFTAQSGGPAILAVLVALIVAFLLSAPVRRTVLRRTVRDPAVTSPDSLRMVLAASAIIAANTLIPLAAFVIPILTLESLGLTTNRINVLFAVIAIATTTGFALQGIARAYLAPGRPGWRYIPIADASAEVLGGHTLVSATLIGLAILIDSVARLLYAPLPVTVLITGGVTFLIGMVGLANLRVLSTGLNVERSADPDRPRFPSLWRWLIPLAWILALGAVIAPLIGYVALGRFLATQLVWSVLTFSLLYLLLKLVDEVITDQFTAGTWFGRLLIGNVGVTGPRLRQLGVVLSGLLRLVLIFLALYLLRLPFGFTTDSFGETARRLFFGFKIGEVSVSPSTILVAVALFIVGYVATRMLQRWLDQRLLPRTELDVGLKTSIQTGMGYVGIIVAAVVAFTYAGLNLENVALVAGALSVGVGFGLQSIVNNFVSGVILLAERPIKVGDWIVVGGQEGTVRRINVRATEIETFDRATVIVPNSDFISGTVMNWMHRNETGRIRIPVGVAYGSDPERVQELLLECTDVSDQIMAFPAPQVFFMEFGASSLDFELRCYLKDINYSLIVKSAIRFEIFRKFREAGIEIPFPQRDINLRDLDRLEALAGISKPAAAPPPSEATPPDRPQSDDESGSTPSS